MGTLARRGPHCTRKNLESTSSGLGFSQPETLNLSPGFADRALRKDVAADRIVRGCFVCTKYPYKKPKVINRAGFSCLLPPPRLRFAADPIQPQARPLALPTGTRHTSPLLHPSSVQTIGAEY